jgi:hypothetical protein
MAAAEEDEVVELRLPALGPVPDVMRVYEPPGLAAREAAAAVASPQDPPHRRRHRARLPPDR